MARFTSLIVVSLSLLIASAAFAQETVTLTVHHFLGTSSPAHTQLIMPWVERIERQSDGRIKVEVFPSMAMGGKPEELYRQVRDGAADIVWTLTSYTPGVFPRTEVFELPTVHQASAENTNRAIQKIYPLIAPDYEEIMPLLIHVHAGNALLLRERPVMELEDIQGMKLRTPGQTAARLVQAWDAEPVGMPVSELPQALAKGAVDGALMPFEVATSLKVPQLVHYAVEGHEDGRFGTSVFLFAMNRERYEALPPDLRAVIDDNSGMALAAEIGAQWDKLENEGRGALTRAGVGVMELSAESKLLFDERAEKVVQQWIGSANERGFDGAELVDEARAAVESFDR